MRYFPMMVGKAPKDSSPKVQDDLNLNKDATWHILKKSKEKIKDD